VVSVFSAVAGPEEGEAGLAWLPPVVLLVVPPVVLLVVLPASGVPVVLPAAGVP
jgi:hypothetical protein